MGLLKYYIITGMNLFIPTVRLWARQFPAWFTPQLRHLLKCYHTRQRKYNKHPTLNNLQRLGRAQCSFHDANVASKSVFEMILFMVMPCAMTLKYFNILRNSLS